MLDDDMRERAYTPDGRWIEYDALPPASILVEGVRLEPVALTAREGRLTVSDVRDMSMAEFSKLRRAMGMPIGRPSYMFPGDMPVRPQSLALSKDAAFRAWQSARTQYAIGGSPQALQEVIDSVRVDEDRYDYYIGRNY
jgi:hypothetical protein